MAYHHRQTFEAEPRLCCPQDDRSGAGGIASFRGRTIKPKTSIRPFWLFCWSARNVDAVKVHTYGDDPGEVSRLMFEISVGWEWGAGGISTGSMKPLDRGTGVFTDDSVWVVR